MVAATGLDTPEDRAMPCEQPTAGELESVDWEGVQETVRAFRQALDRGERPALEAYAAGETGEPKGRSDRADPRRDGGPHHRG